MPNTTSNMGLHQGIDGDNSKTLIETHYAADATVIDTHDHSTDAKGLTVGRVKSGLALASPVVSGAAATAAGTLGFSGTNLLVGDGSAIESVNIGAWTDMSGVIVLSQGSAVAATVNIAHYVKMGRRAEIFLQVTASANGTGGQAIIVSGLPAAILPATNNTSVVTGWGMVSGAPSRLGALLAFTSGSLEILVDNSGVVGVAPAVTLANGINVTMWGSWETAS